MVRSLSSTGSGNIALGAECRRQCYHGKQRHLYRQRRARTWTAAALIGNIFGVTTQSGVTNTSRIVSNTGQLGTFSSSRRFKHDIKPMDKASEAILSLKPVAFHYKDDTKNIPCFGLIAEEVAVVDPTLVIRDEKGAPFTVRYDQINAMLLNEFLKGHRKVEQQQATIAELKATVAHQQKRFADQEKQIAALTSGLQKVSAQIETSKPARQLAATKN